ncbi:transposase [Bradyrhizobium sp. USDA 4354]
MRFIAVKSEQQQAAGLVLRTRDLLVRQRTQLINAIRRDFAAWLGLTRLQRSTGGKQKIGATSKMGERTFRRLLIIGSSAVVQQASNRGAPRGSWLEQMMARKPRMLVTVALANKMAGSSGHYL